MAAPTSKLLNLRNPTLHILFRRHLLHPIPAAASIFPIPAQSLNLLHPQNTTTSWPENSSTAINLKFHVPLQLQLPIEAARGYSPSPPKDDVDIDVEDDEDEFDDDDDEINIDELSGLEYADEDEDDDDNEVRRPDRK